MASVLERHINVNITFGNKNNRHKNIIGIGSINNFPPAIPDKSQPATPDGQQDSNNHINIETIDKLRGFGLRDEQIAEALGLPLEAVKQI